MKASWKTRIARLLPEELIFRIRWLRDPLLIRRLAPESWPPYWGVRRLVKPGDVVVDVGANIGFASRILSELVEEKGIVLALEPVPPTYRLLTHNVRVLRLRNVRAIHAAAGARREKRKIVIPRYSDGRENIYESRLISGVAEEQTGRVFEIEVRSLDEVARSCVGARRISLIKIDVEGSEVEVVEGALEILERDRPGLVIETSGIACICDTRLGRLVALLSPLGYRPFHGSPTGFEAVREDERVEGDIFFLTG